MYFIPKRFRMEIARSHFSFLSNLSSQPVAVFEFFFVLLMIPAATAMPLKIAYVQYRLRT